MPDEQMDGNADFEAWKLALPTVTVDGIRYFVVRGDDLRDEDEIRRLWDKNLSAGHEEHRITPGESLQFLDVSPDSPSTEEEPTPKPTKDNHG